MIRSHCGNTLLQKQEPKLLFEYIVATMETEAILRTHCYDSLNWDHCSLTTMEDHIIATVTLNIIVAVIMPFEFQWFESTVSSSRGYQPATCWRHRPWRGVRTTCRISVYSKEYTFPIVFILSENSLFARAVKPAGMLTLQKMVHSLRGTYRRGKNSKHTASGGFRRKSDYDFGCDGTGGHFKRLNWRDSVIF
jgi:hypothetical protein